MVKRRTFKKSLGTRRQQRPKAQVVTSMVRYRQPKASTMYQNLKVEISVPLWIYGTLGGDTYSLSGSSNTWHLYILTQGQTYPVLPELRSALNSYLYYKVNGASIAYCKTYGSSSVNEIRQAPPLAFNIGPALSNTQTSNLVPAEVFDMDDSYRIQPLSDDKELNSRYYRFFNMRSGQPATYGAAVGEWENTAIQPTVLFSLGYKEVPENAADASIRIGAAIVTIYFTFMKPAQANTYT